MLRKAALTPIVAPAFNQYLFSYLVLYIHRSGLQLSILAPHRKTPTVCISILHDLLFRKSQQSPSAVPFVVVALSQHPGPNLRCKSVRPIASFSGRENTYCCKVLSSNQQLSRGHSEALIIHTYLISLDLFDFLIYLVFGGRRRGCSLALLSVRDCER